jgi:arylsulfatase A-like enzyme
MSIDADALTVIEDLYRGAIRHADDGLRELIKTLENNNQLSETIVILFGDHGNHSGHDGHFGHQFSVGDRLLRVPLLAYDPTSTLQLGRSEDIV